MIPCQSAWNTVRLPLLIIAILACLGPTAAIGAAAAHATSPSAFGAADNALLPPPKPALAPSRHTIYFRASVIDSATFCPSRS